MFPLNYHISLNEYSIVLLESMAKSLYEINMICIASILGAMMTYGVNVVVLGPI